MPPASSHWLQAIEVIENMVIQSDETSPSTATTAITQILPQYKMVRISRVNPTPWSVCNSAGTDSCCYSKATSLKAGFPVLETSLFWCCPEVGLDASKDD